MKLSPKRDALKRTLKNSTMLILASKISACGGGSPSNTETTPQIPLMKYQELMEQKL